MKANRITTNIRQVIENKRKRASATFVETSDKSYWLYRGDRISPRHFDLMLPIQPMVYKTY